MSRHNFQVGDLVTLDSVKWNSDGQYCYPVAPPFHDHGIGLVMADANTYFQSLAERKAQDKHSPFEGEDHLHEKARVLVKFSNDHRIRWWPCAYLNLASGVGG